MDPTYVPPPTSLNPDATLTDRIAEIGIIRPDDTLIVRVDPGCSAEQIYEAKTLLERLVPDVAIVIIAAEQAALRILGWIHPREIGGYRTADGKVWHPADVEIIIEP